MNGPEHYREAERLAKLGAEMWVSPEGEYDDTEPPSPTELATRAAVQEQAFQQAAVVLAEAQVHATLALAAAVGALDSFTGPISGYATGRLDRDEWEAVTGKGGEGS